MKSLSSPSDWVRDLDLFGTNNSTGLNWFKDELVHRVGDGSATRHLYNLSTNQDDHICEFALNINKSDSSEWKFDKSKVYSVQSAYKAITHHIPQQNLTLPYPNLLWKSNAPLKVLTFAWRLFQDIIPTKDVLLKRGIPLNNGGDLHCVFCNDNPETANHLFSSCKLSYSV
ncbi:hypothetical protein Lal_00017892 [Lupinus albus]|nr:hypothetical protein Lal_00017892 [Lupinus albus]